MKGGVLLYIFTAVTMVTGCKSADKEVAVAPTTPADTSFTHLVSLTGLDPARAAEGSLSVLIIPVDAACNSCRDESVDKLIEHQKDLRNDQYVVITGASKKIIDLYFSSRSLTMPDFGNHVYIDSTSFAFKKNLVFSHPVVFQTEKGKIINKIVSKPMNIAEVLKDYFHQ
jgi:hypothetical protein